MSKTPVSAVSTLSLRAAVQGVNDHLDRLSHGHHRSTDVQSAARGLLAELIETRTTDIFDRGLHEFLEDFKGKVADLGRRVSDTYLIGAMA